MEPKHRELLVNSLLAYGLFGFSQVAYRLAAGRADFARARRMMKDIPYARGCEGSMDYARGLSANLHRMNEFKLEAFEGFPVCKLLGFPWAMDQHAIIVNNAQRIRHFLKDKFDTYTKSPPSNAFWIYVTEFLGAGIFTALHGLGSSDRGQSWANMRKTSAQIFNRKNFNTLMQQVL